jgi:hypothetical protein
MRPPRCDLYGYRVSDSPFIDRGRDSKTYATSSFPFTHHARRQRAARESANGGDEEGGSLLG